MKKTQFPAGWSDSRVRDVLDHYENQSDQEAVEEHESALARPDHALMTIPHELVPQVRQLLADHETKRSH